ncbi:unnamed protein product [Ectocarpus sp. 12 AP-2014]
MICYTACFSSPLRRRVCIQERSQVWRLKRRNKSSRHTLLKKYENMRNKLTPAAGTTPNPLSALRSLCIIVEVRQQALFVGAFAQKYGQVVLPRGPVRFPILLIVVCTSNACSHRELTHTAISYIDKS